MDPAFAAARTACIKAYAAMIAAGKHAAEVGPNVKAAAAYTAAATAYDTAKVAYNIYVSGKEPK